MSKDDPDIVARTYRLEGPVWRDLKKLQKEMRVAPSETAMVNAALREFVKNMREQISKGVAA